MLYPGIFSLPSNVGFVGSDKSITSNGSVSLNVTTYAILSTNLTEYILSPLVSPPSLPICSKFSFNMYIWFVSSFKLVLEVVATLKFPLYSSNENWLLVLPSTSPLHCKFTFAPYKLNLYIVLVGLLNK